MLGRRLVLLVALGGALTAGGCMRSTQSYLVYDPNTGQQYTTTAIPQAYGQPPSQQAQGFELYGQGNAGPVAQGYTQSYAQASPQRSAGLSQQQPIENRGLFTSRRSSSYAAPRQVSVQQPYVVQYTAPQPQTAYAQGTYAPRGVAQGGSIPSYGSYAAPVYPQTAPAQTAPRATYAYPSAAYPTAYGSYAASTPPNYGTYSYGSSYAYAPAAAPSYTLDAGDRLRVVVFGQDGLSNTYTVDAGGNINMPLIGTLAVRGTTTQQVAQLITARLKQGYVREPHVSVEIEAYRPFFILGEVNNPGQYPYVANMTAEAAVAIAGGFSPRASKSKVELTRSAPGQQVHGLVPLNYPLKPGDTIVVKERWF